MKSIRLAPRAFGCLLLLLPLTAAQAADKTPTNVPLAQRQAFQLGFALQSPAAQTEGFLQAVKKLKEISDETQSTAEIGKLAKQSAALRASELRAYRQAEQRLHEMNAPAILQAWPEHAETRLAAPLVVSPQEKAGSDPDTATILGTIDEAQDLKTNGNRHMPDLVSWLKLTQGGDAVWATALGGLTAGMHAAVVADRSLSLSLTDILRLRDTAPFGTPPPVLNTLTELSPKTGNLAGLIRLPETPIPPKELKRPQTTFLNAYAAAPLAAMIDSDKK